MLPPIQIICVGKYKDSNFESLERHYLKQIKKLKVIELKSFAEDIKKEEIELRSFLAKYHHEQVILLTEKGKRFKDSIEFARFINEKSLSINKTIIFVISGAMGFSQAMKNEFQSLSLSGLTLPHKLCRLVLVEQIYRSQTILSGHPYHN